jgi:hypothetical protein
MEGKPEKASVTQSPRKPPPFVSGSPYQSQNLLPFIGTFEDVQVEVGIGVGGSSRCEKPLPRGPLSHVWVSIALFVFYFLFCLFRIFVVVFVSAPESASMYSLSLSLSLSLFLSLLPLDISVYLYIFSVRLPSKVSAKKQRQAQS